MSEYNNYNSNSYTNQDSNNQTILQNKILQPNNTEYKKPEYNSSISYLDIFLKCEAPQFRQLQQPIGLINCILPGVPLWSCCCFYGFDRKDLLYVSMAGLSHTITAIAVYGWVSSCVIGYKLMQCTCLDSLFEKDQQVNYNQNRNTDINQYRPGISNEQQQNTENTNNNQQFNQFQQYNNPYSYI